MYIKIYNTKKTSEQEKKISLTIKLTSY